DPSGALMEYKASSEGAGRSGAMSYFEEHYKEGLEKDEAIELGVNALHKATEGKLSAEATEIGIVDKEIKFNILTTEKTKEYVEKALGGN
ncbi:MAG: proteasome subunit alpha, partial [Candidatus Thermoplasmatota archaeon]